jgi:hypothetical protein
MNNIHPFNVAISYPVGKIFIDDDHINHISNSVFTNKGTAVSSITMDRFMEGNQIETMELLKVNIEVAERLLIGSFKKISGVKHVTISCRDFYTGVRGIIIL